MDVIYYGAGAWLAQNFKRLTLKKFSPLCVCDADTSKQNRPFAGKNLMVLPLDKALEKYPDVPIYVTVDNTKLGEILHYLTAEKNIPSNQIINYAPIEYRMGCPMLETTIKFRTKRIFVRCYWRHPGIDRTNDTASDIQRFDDWRKTTVAEINNGNKTTCDGCEHLKKGWYLKNPVCTNLQLSESDNYSFCNFNCVYCFVHSRNKIAEEAKLPENDEQLEALKYVADNIVGEPELQFSTGEITVHPHKDIFLDLFKKYQTMLFTNAAIYDEKIAELMNKGTLSLVVSMDCGTREKFKEIKRVDCFDKVCSNLEMYASTGGCVILKYIMLEGINDNYYDADGFVALAVRLGAVIQLSNDTRTKRKSLSENALNTICHIAVKARENNLLVIHEKDVFSIEDNEIIKGVLNGLHQNVGI